MPIELLRVRKLVYVTAVTYRGTETGWYSDEEVQKPLALALLLYPGMRPSAWWPFLTRRQWALQVRFAGAPNEEAAATTGYCPISMLPGIGNRVALRLKTVNNRGGISFGLVGVAAK